MEDTGALGEARVAFSARGSWIGFAVMAAVLSAPVPGAADVVTLKDGRKYEGKIISEDGERVRIDTLIGRARTGLGFPVADVESIEKAPLPAGFFEPPPAAERVSDPTAFKPGQPLYLEVPVIGDIGKDVHADAVSDVLRYAKRHRIDHIVFNIDSADGDPDEAVALYDVLKAQKGKLRMHVIARRCIGPALVIPVWASSLNILPGATLGILPPETRATDEEMEMSRAQLAYKVVSESERKGLGAEILRTMVDPDNTLCVWKDAEGTLAFDAVCPDGVPEESVIVQVGAGETLELTAELAKALGLKEFKGGPQDLGEHLGIEGWAAESDYGVKTVAKVAAEKQKAAKAKQASLDGKISKNLTRRQTTEDYISHCLKEAASWDPTKGSYQTYSSHYNWGWGWSSPSAENQYTIESQKKWKSRTDACMYYIQCAAKGLAQMKTLEADASKLGLEAIYKPGEIDTMIKDLNVKYKLLGANRGKTGN